MTDENFLKAMKIEAYPTEESDRALCQALRIDDLRSDYCQELESRVAEQAATIRLLQFLLQLKHAP